MSQVVFTELEKEGRRRIQVALWAYAYEIKSDPLVSDDVFDKTCSEINLNTSTDNVEMDTWFKENFDPCTGQWIYVYPYLEKLENKYKRIRPNGKPT